METKLWTLLAVVSLMTSQSHQGLTDMSGWGFGGTKSTTPKPTTTEAYDDNNNYNDNNYNNNNNNNNYNNNNYNNNNKQNKPNKETIKEDKEFNKLNVSVPAKEPFFKPFQSLPTFQNPLDQNKFNLDQNKLNLDQNKFFNNTAKHNVTAKIDKQHKNKNNTTYVGVVENPVYTIPAPVVDYGYNQMSAPQRPPYGGGGYGQGSHGNQHYGPANHHNPRPNGPTYRGQTPYQNAPNRPPQPQPYGGNHNQPQTGNNQHYRPQGNGNGQTPYPHGNNHNTQSYHGVDAPIYNGNHELPIYNNNGPQTPHGPNGPIHNAQHYGNDQYSQPTPVDYSKYVQPHSYNEVSQYMSPERYNEYSNMLYTAYNLPPVQYNTPQPNYTAPQGYQQSNRDNKFIVAVVVIDGSLATPPTPVRGTLFISQIYVKIVLVSGVITHLVPNYKYGLAIHQFGDLTNGCYSIGGHYNPGNNTHGNLNHPQSHAGDLGNIVSDVSGVAFVNKIVRNKFSIEDSNPIAGRSIGLCKNADDLGQGGTYSSIMHGSCGEYIGCGSVGYANTGPPPQPSGRGYK